MSMEERLLRFERVVARIQEAARRSGRDAGEITLVGVSKGVDVETIQQAQETGVSVFGENRVQEAIGKFPPPPRPYAVHLIGSLQSNKVKWGVGFFDLIHSVDSLSLAQKINAEAARQSVSQSVLVQVNIGGEASKHGISVKEAPGLVASIRALTHLSLRGLMVIPPVVATPDMARPYFSKLRQMGEGLGLCQFSMGMSSDFEVAIEEGATWVRIGEALFGSRASMASEG